MEITRGPITFHCLEAPSRTPAPGMKAKSKTSPPRPARPARAVSAAKLHRAAGAAPRGVVPLKNRRLDFGTKWDFTPAPETFDYLKIPARHELFINGKFVAPRLGKFFESLNPATEDKLSEIAVAD